MTPSALQAQKHQDRKGGRLFYFLCTPRAYISGVRHNKKNAFRIGCSFKLVRYGQVRATTCRTRNPGRTTEYTSHLADVAHHDGVCLPQCMSLHVVSLTCCGTTNWGSGSTAINRFRFILRTTVRRDEQQAE